MTLRTGLRAIAIFLLIQASMVVYAKDRTKDNLKDAQKESQKAAEVLGEIMRTPDKAIPNKVFDSAECVAVFPSTIKGGFIVGARKGEGVVSCRTSRGWSAPVYLNMAGGSIGPQIGVQSTDFVLLFMNRTGVDHLLKNEFTVGGEASVAAGPVGREAGASTDWKLNAEILSYSRSKGAFVGAALNGVKISQDKSDMKDVYGANYNSAAILRENKVTAPAGVRAFPDALARYSSRRAEENAVPGNASRVKHR
jgi:lipid-binding SYLF domain-containing protein